MRLPTLTTDRLIIRELTSADWDAVCSVLDPGSAERDVTAWRQQRLAWLEWTISGYEQFDRLFQPPFGERALALRETGLLVGLVGCVPCLGPFAQLPPPDGSGAATGGGSTLETGLYWAVAPEYRGRGYATEAGSAMASWLVHELQLRRVVATTTYGNLPSQAVMRKIGMRLQRNPHGDPPWLQVVGVLGREQFAAPSECASSERGLGLDRDQHSGGNGWSVKLAARRSSRRTS